MFEEDELMEAAANVVATVDRARLALGIRGVSELTSRDERIAAVRGRIVRGLDSDLAATLACAAVSECVSILRDTALAYGEPDASDVALWALAAAALGYEEEVH